MTKQIAKLKHRLDFICQKKNTNITIKRKCEKEINIKEYINERKVLLYTQIVVNKRLFSIRRFSSSTISACDRTAFRAFN